MANIISEYDASIGKRIRKIREEKGITQTELSKICGFSSYTSISKIEAGERKLSNENLVKIANALHVKPHTLIEPNIDYVVSADGMDDIIIEIQNMRLDNHKLELLLHYAKYLQASE